MIGRRYRHSFFSSPPTSSARLLLQSAEM